MTHYQYSARQQPNGQAHAAPPRPATWPGTPARHVPPPAPPKAPAANRLIALDAARGLAVIGMYIQHYAGDFVTSPIVSGNTTLLFVLCGGIAYSLMAHNSARRGEPVTLLRGRMLARSIFIDLLGYGLILLNTPFGVILPAYAVLFVLALTLVRRSTRTLVFWLIGLLFIAPPLMILGPSLLRNASLLADIAGGPMSALALSPAFVAGMIIGRARLQQVRTGLVLLAVGVVLVLVNLALAQYVLPTLRSPFELALYGSDTPSASAPAATDQPLTTTPAADEGAAADGEPLSSPSSTTSPDAALSSAPSGGSELPKELAPWPLNADDPLWIMMVSISPHSASTFQTLLGIGAGSIALGACILLARVSAIILRPLVGIGRLPLTFYTLQFLVIWPFALVGNSSPLGGVPLGALWLTLGLLVVGVLVPSGMRGPLESLMRAFESTFLPSPSRGTV